MTTSDFAQRIAARYPEGLTGVFAIGATRRTYILDCNRQQENPGHIDFEAMGTYLGQRYRAFIKMFLDLGGQNMIITALSFRSFFERGDEYAWRVVPEALRLQDSEFTQFYQEQNIDPYFVGIDTLFKHPEGSAPRHLAERLQAFQQSWPYQAGRRKLLWEIASLPLYSMWNLISQMPAEKRAAIDEMVAAAPSTEALAHVLNREFSCLVYGTEMPFPHFYLGTNMSGDLKWRSPMPLALTGGEYLRMFYTPYPTLFITPDTLEAMLEDLAFGKRFFSRKVDYKDRYTPELVQREYERIEQLASSAESMIGLVRQVSDEE